jgi:hypothetical protein
MNFGDTQMELPEDALDFEQFVLVRNHHQQ